MTRLKVVALILIIGCFCAVSFAAVLTLLKIRELAVDLDVSVRMSDTILRNVNDSTKNISSASFKWSQAANAEIIEVHKTQAAIREAVVFTDKNLNDPASGVLPQLRVAIVDTNKNFGLVSDSVAATAQSLKPITENVARVTAIAAESLADPNIKDAVKNIDATTLELAQATQDVHTETTLIVGETRKAFKPENKFVSILKAVAGGTVTGAELFYYLTH